MKKSLDRDRRVHAAAVADSSTGIHWCRVVDKLTVGCHRRPWKFPSTHVNEDLLVKSAAWDTSESN